MSLLFDVKVNGEDQMPVFKFLKSQCPSPMKEYYDVKYLSWKPFHEDDISWEASPRTKMCIIVIFRWSYEKFLINKQGEPVMRYGLLARPEDMVTDIEKLLRYP